MTLEKRLPWDLRPYMIVSSIIEWNCVQGDTYFVKNRVNTCRPHYAVVANDSRGRCGSGLSLILSQEDKCVSEQ